MTPALFAACIALAVTLGFGQMLFKLAAEDIKVRLDDSLWSAAVSPWLLGALFLYAFGTVLWVGILIYVPLSRAYPFAMLGTALVPVLAVVVLGESLSPYYAVGIALVILGVAITQTM